jgi:L-threonylcarbamoyladenylate synthase
VSRVFEGGSPGAVDAAVSALEGGGVAILPADTVYNFYGRADLRASIDRVYDIKRRDRGKPFIVYTNRGNVGRWVEVTPLAEELMDAFWPQALSIVLRKTPAIPDWFGAGTPTIAVMTASNPIVGAVVERVDAPLFGTTVNHSDEPSAVTAAQAMRFAPLVDVMIADDAALVYRAASTMVDCTVWPPAILREEAIPVEAVRRAFPDVVVDLARLK